MFGHMNSSVHAVNGRQSAVEMKSYTVICTMHRYACFEVTSFIFSLATIYSKTSVIRAA